jgi:hypothetical protein
VVQPAPAAAPAAVSPAAPALVGTKVPSAAPDPYAIAEGVKPTGLEDKFWNPESKAIRLPELMKSYAEAQSLIGRRAADMNEPDFLKLVDARLGTMTTEIQTKALKELRGEAPAAAKDYQIQLSNEAMVQLPEAMRDTAQLDTDPLVGWFREYAHELGLGPQQFNKAMEGYLTTVAAAQAAGIASEQSKLGPTGQKRLETLANYLTANLEKRQAMALMGVMSSAEAVAAVESLVKKLGDPSSIRGFGGMNDMGSVGPGLSTEAEVRHAQRDPRYWDPSRRDPAYVKAVESAWQRLFPPGRGGTA